MYKYPEVEDSLRIAQIGHQCLHVCVQREGNSPLPILIRFKI